MLTRELEGFRWQARQVVTIQVEDVGVAGFVDPAVGLVDTFSVSFRSP
ncbi:hypothetical protein [Kibdelosporangium philippinense]